jgi:hypothetical protein
MESDHHRVRPHWRWPIKITNQRPSGYICRCRKTFHTPTLQGRLLNRGAAIPLRNHERRGISWWECPPTCAAVMRIHLGTCIANLEDTADARRSDMFIILISKIDKGGLLRPHPAQGMKYPRGRCMYACRVCRHRIKARFESHFSTIPALPKYHSAHPGIVLITARNIELAYQFALKLNLVGDLSSHLAGGVGCLSACQVLQLQ